MILKTLKQKLSVEKFLLKLIFAYLHLKFPSWNFLAPKKMMRWLYLHVEASRIFLNSPYLFKTLLYLRLKLSKIFYSRLFPNFRKI